MKLQLSENLLDQMKRHALASGPHECCGILIGRRLNRANHVTRIEPAENIAEGDPARSYQIDWQALFGAVRRARIGADGIVGFYHSHPNGSAQPSVRDIDLAWPDCAYVILAMTADRSAEVTGWCKGGATQPFRQIPIEVIADRCLA